MTELDPTATMPDAPMLDTAGASGSLFAEEPRTAMVDPTMAPPAVVDPPIDLTEPTPGLTEPTPGFTDPPRGPASGV